MTDTTTPDAETLAAEAYGLGVTWGRNAGLNCDSDGEALHHRDAVTPWAVVGADVYPDGTARYMPPARAAALDVGQRAAWRAAWLAGFAAGWGEYPQAGRTFAVAQRRADAEAAEGV